MHISHNEKEQRFETQTASGHTAFVAYWVQNGTMTLAHTQVPPEDEGKGIGGRLAAGVFDYLRAHHITAKVTCPFLIEYLQRNPENLDVVEG